MEIELEKIKSKIAVIERWLKHSQKFSVSVFLYFKIIYIPIFY
jgi:hypothetical protein